jgi:hypothetical protein
MKLLLLAFALAFVMIGGAVTVSAVTTTPVAACPNNSGC